MKNYIHSTILIFVVILYSLIQSCKRQPLEDEGSVNLGSTISVTIDWVLSALDSQNIENVSLYAYPKSGGSPYLKISGNIDSLAISLPVGEYSLLLINDAVQDIGGISFRDENIFDEFSANTIVDSVSSKVFYQTQSDETFVQELSGLAAWRVTDFVVTDSMVNCQYCCEVHSDTMAHYQKITPLPVTANCTVELYVENLTSAQIIQAVLKGFSNGAYIASNKRIEVTGGANLYSVDFTEFSYDNSSNPQDGSVVTSLLTFGKQPIDSSIYEIEVQVILTNGELMSFTRDVTEQVEGSDDFNIFINLSDSINKIILPDNLSTGFGVDSWGENEQVELI